MIDKYRFMKVLSSFSFENRITNNEELLYQGKMINFYSEESLIKQKLFVRLWAIKLDFRYDDL